MKNSYSRLFFQTNILFEICQLNIELVQLKLNIGTSVEDSTPTEAGIRNPTYRSGGLMN